MAHMLYCPIHQKVWAYDYEEENHNVVEIVCPECENALYDMNEEINAAS